MQRVGNGRQKKDNLFSEVIFSNVYYLVYKPVPIHLKQVPEPLHL